jgi:uncharacterized membrane protein
MELTWGLLGFVLALLIAGVLYCVRQIARWSLVRFRIGRSVDHSRNRTLNSELWTSRLFRWPL